MKNNIEPGILYGYVHFITEIVCFYSLYSIINSDILWIIALLYDTFAFTPEGLIGFIKDKYPKLNIGLIGILILLLGVLLLSFNNYISIFLIALGNAFIHVSGALVTINTSNGKLSSSGIFIGCGSFGVILGKILSSYNISIVILILLILSMLPFIYICNKYKYLSLDNYNYHNKNINKISIILLTLLIVIIRGYMAYSIPTSWVSNTFESILLFFTMGIGKILGGILVDKYGIKNISILSVLLSIPFLIIGDNNIILSLVGISLFSMTMSITLAILVSLLKRPSLSFGLTTIGLYLGSIPAFFIKINSFYINSIVIIVLSMLCIFIFNKVLRKGNHGSSI